MLEPSIKRVSAPTEEPICSIGVVTVDDKAQSILFCVDQDATLSGNSGNITLRANLRYEAKVRSGAISFLSSDGKEIMSTGKGTLSFPKITPGKNPVTTFFGLRAGRNFHWEKRIDATFYGTFEFIWHQNFLLVINLLPLEKYIACVVTSEMSAHCPPEFVKAQAVSARSWALVFLGSKHPGLPYSICNDDCCQRYQGTTYSSPTSISAALSCRGEYLTDSDGHVCAAYYSKSCGGHFESSKDALSVDIDIASPTWDSEGAFSPQLNLSSEGDFKKWWLEEDSRLWCSPKAFEGHDLSRYLGAVDDGAGHFRWEYRISNIELSATLGEKTGKQISSIVSINPRLRGKSGRLLSIDINCRTQKQEELLLTISSQYEIRRVLHPSFLYSSAFFVETNHAEFPDFTFKGCGWGHGVGLCQIGAVSMSLKGQSYKDILNHYFNHSKLLKSYD